MGEAKVLVEMELDRDFPKIITLDDKQGNIFLVEVEYTWIPSTCGRCGNLGHKEKRCLLTSKLENVLQQQEEQHDRSDIPVVDIDVILQQRDPKTAKSSPTANPMKPKVKETRQQLLVVDHGVSANHSYCSGFDQETCNTLSGIRSPSSHSQHEEPANTLISVTIPSPLVDSQSTPTHSQIMETSPSNITKNAVLGSSDVGAFVTSSFSLTRGGRESKAPIKYHNMEWKTVRGRGNRGRRGRSSSH
ncbi:hypothetical protein Bca4012_028388 [Brassica carinata]